MATDPDSPLPTSRPSRRWLKIAAIVLLTFAGSELAARGIENSAPEPLRYYDAVAQAKIAQMDDSGHADIVFAGTSMAWQALTPSVFESDGRVAYNASLNGGVPGVMQRWLLNEVEPRLQPGVVVWGLSSLDLAPAYGEQNIEAYDEALATRTGWLSELEQRTADRLALIRLRPMFRDPAELWGQAAADRERSFAISARLLGPAGSRNESARDLSDERRAIQQARLSGFAPSNLDIAAIRETVIDLRSRGVQVVLVELPVPPRFVDLHPLGSSDHRLTGFALQAVAEDTGVTFLRFVEDFENNDFVDFTHLTRSAADYFSGLVADALEQGSADNLAEITPIEVPEAPADQEDDSNCRLEFVVDEYGFEFEIEVCGRGPIEQGERSGPETKGEPPALSDWIATRSARQTAADLRDRLVGQTGCAIDVASFDVNVPDVITQPLIDLLADLDAMDAACNVDEQAWLEGLESSIASIISLAAIAGAPTSPAVTFTGNDVTDRTALAIAASDHLFATLAGRLDPTAIDPTNYFISVDELSLARHLNVNAAPDIALIGSSITLRAFDQDELNGSLDVSVLNAALRGADPEEWFVVLPRLFNGLAQPDEIIWSVTTHRLLLRRNQECDSLIARRTAATQDLQEAAFSTPLVTADLSFNELVFGPQLAGRYQDTIPAEAYASQFIGVGERNPLDGEFSRVRPREVSNAYSPPRVCAARFDLMQRAIEGLQERGVTVKVVLLPVNAAVVALAPDEHQELENRLRAVARSTGVEFIALPGPLLDSETFDGWHANLDGQSRLTADLVKALQG